MPFHLAVLLPFQHGVVAHLGNSVQFTDDAASRQRPMDYGFQAFPSKFLDRVPVRSRPPWHRRRELVVSDAHEGMKAAAARANSGCHGSERAATEHLNVTIFCCLNRTFGSRLCAA